MPFAELVWLGLAVCGAGVVTGILAGLFGIGGGAVIVPVLYEVFRLLEVPEASLRAHLGRLERVRRERDGEAVGSALAALRDAARQPGSSEANLMPHFLRCALAYATLGEQCAVLREVFGEYREPVAV